MNTTGLYQRQGVVWSVSDGIAIRLTRTGSLICRKTIAGTQVGADGGHGATQNIHGGTVIFLYVVVRIINGYISTHQHR